MKILVIGSGGREHALVWKLSQSPKVEKIYCAPGNAGIAQLATNVTLSPEDIEGLIHFAQRVPIDLTVVGPEVPLSLGIVDAFEKAGLRIFGPHKNAAILEFSKIFTKEFCNRHHIPTAFHEVFTNVQAARSVIEKRKKYPLVIKADGLAAGKGVVIAKNFQEASQAIEDMFVYERFGEAGRRVVFEEFLNGEEATFMVATDGVDFVCLESAQDHKRAFDHDKGPNTGGMGAYSPAPIVTPAMREKIIETIIRPTLYGMREENRPYQGILYAGLMIDPQGKPWVIEFNCRFGDPEAQPILFRMQSDLVDLIEAVMDHRLQEYKIKFSKESAVCVVLAAGGYPGSFEKGKLIRGLPQVSDLKDVYVFHAGTKIEDEHYFSNGGRVLGVTARGKNLQGAIDKAYQAISHICWDDMHYRKDIGQKGLQKQ